MPRRQKKLVCWLRRVLDEETFKHLGMMWENEVDQTFWIPWPRQHTHRWTPDDSVHFLEYVKMQNPDDGQEPNYVKWKTRFRAALTKEPSIIEHKLQYGNEKTRKLYQLKNQDSTNATAKCANKDKTSSAPSAAAPAGESSDPTDEAVPPSTGTVSGISDDRVCSEAHLEAEQLSNIAVVNSEFTDYSVEMDDYAVSITVDFTDEWTPERINTIAENFPMEEICEKSTG